MKAVIDEDLLRSLGETLQALGFEVFDVRDHGLRGKSDEDIFNFAQREQAVLFSGDLGFANTLRFPPGTHAGIVILRFPNEMLTAAINTSVQTLLTKVSKQDLDGNLIILSPFRIRLRRRQP